jgi:diacylglycerol kinase
MKILKSFAFAWNGLKVCFETETNFKIHLFFAAITILLGINFHLSQTEWLIVAICITVVLITEMLNTAIEKLCDVVEPEFHQGIKQVKDIAAAAVLVAAFMSTVIGVIIFLPKILILLKSL